MEGAILIQPERGGDLRHAGAAEHAGGKALGREIDRADLGQNLADGSPFKADLGAQVADIDGKVVKPVQITLQRLDSVQIDPLPRVYSFEAMTSRSL